MAAITRWRKHFDVPGRKWLEHCFPSCKSGGCKCPHGDSMETFVARYHLVLCGVACLFVVLSCYFIAASVASDPPVKLHRVQVSRSYPGYQVSQSKCIHVRGMERRSKSEGVKLAFDGVDNALVAVPAVYNVDA